MNGHAPDFSLANSFEIENTGDKYFLAFQKSSQLKGEIFVDAAHLTDYANDLVAQCMAEKILEHKF